MLAMRQKLLDHAQKFATDAFKTALKRAIRKRAESDNLVEIKFLIKLQSSLKIHHIMFQRQFQMKHKILDLIEKYQRKVHIFRKKTANY